MSSLMNDDPYAAPEPSSFEPDEVEISTVDADTWRPPPVWAVLIVLQGSLFAGVFLVVLFWLINA